MSPAASTRWCPTPDQLMILEELYRSGIRTPNASQIQRITAHLSLYGKIEGKNVFYWFQNHKARDRQKLRRRLLKQLQQQQQQQQLYDYKQDQLLQNNPSNSHLLSYFDPAATLAFHDLSYHHNSASILPHQGGTEGVAPTQLMNCRWKVDSPPRSHEMEKSVMMRMYSHDWMMMADAVGPPSPCCSSSSSTRPLQTLELFPITATNLKEESSSKHLSSSK